MSILKAGRPTAKQKALAEIRNIEKLVRIAVIVPKSLHKQVKQRVVLEETTISKVINDFLHNYVKA